MEASRSRDATETRRATLYAAQVPLEVAEACPEIAELCGKARKLGLQASASDAGVGAAMARSAVVGAAMNVYINLQDISGEPDAAELLRRADAAVQRTEEIAGAIVDEVWESLRPKTPSA